jgi:hypothetical protein
VRALANERGMPVFLALAPGGQELLRLRLPDWSAAELARHTQAVLQGAFVLAKAFNDAQIVLDEIAHLRRYVEHLLPTSRKRRTTCRTH